MLAKQQKNNKNTQSQNTPNSFVQNGQFKTGQITLSSPEGIIPAPIAQKLTQMTAQYGLPIDLGKITLKNLTPQTVKQTRMLVDLMVSNSKLLPEMIKLAKKLMNADIKLVEFHKELCSEALKHQTKLDRATADIFLQMLNYQRKASRLETKMQQRSDLIQKREQAWNSYQQNSVFADASQVITVEAQVSEANHKALTESKVAKMEARSQRKQKEIEYLSVAFE